MRTDTRTHGESNENEVNKKAVQPLIMLNVFLLLSLSALSALCLISETALFRMFLLRKWKVLPRSGSFINHVISIVDI